MCYYELLNRLGMFSNSLEWLYFGVNNDTALVGAAVRLSEKNLPELLTGEQLHKARCLSSDADSDDGQEVSVSADPRLRGWGAGRVLVAAEEGTPDAMSVSGCILGSSLPRADVGKSHCCTWNWGGFKRRGMN